MVKNQHSQQNLSIKPSRILLLGTGGTIAGLTNEVAGHASAGYRAAQLAVNDLLPATQHQISAEQLAQIDSKDMSFDVWARLWERLAEAMQDVSIDAVVVTHGTDTMEETAYFLHRTVTATKPVILTGAMRPADSHEADGPKNLVDAFDLASQLDAGVWVVWAGRAMPALGLQKNHPQDLNAFGLREECYAPGVAPLLSLRFPVRRWPRVEIVMNYAQAGGGLVDALIQQKVDGIVVAGTGNGTLSCALEAALLKASKDGIAVCLSTRCWQGRVLQDATHLFEVSPLSPVQARVELILSLLAKGVT